MMRALRPDRMTYAVQGFVEEKLGAKFVEHRSVEFSKSFEESGTPQWHTIYEHKYDNTNFISVFTLHFL